MIVNHSSESESRGWGRKVLAAPGGGAVQLPLGASTGSAVCLLIYMPVSVSPHSPQISSKQGLCLFWSGPVLDT